AVPAARTARFGEWLLRLPAARCGDLLRRRRRLDADPGRQDLRHRSARGGQERGNLIPDESARIRDRPDGRGPSVQPATEGLDGAVQSDAGILKKDVEGGRGWWRLVEVPSPTSTNLHNPSPSASYHRHPKHARRPGPYQLRHPQAPSGGP